METKELTNDTTLRWEANREPDLAGYVCASGAKRPRPSGSTLFPLVR